MCDAVSLVGLGLIAALAVSLVSAALAFSRARAQLQARHPKAWSWLGKWEVRFPDGEVQEAALTEFLWSGMYRTLGDEHLNRAALRLKLAAGASAAIELALLTLEYARHDMRFLSCIGA